MVEAVDTPDRHRLARIEQQLLAGGRRRGARNWRWIVLGFGLATGAVAAYWGVYGHETAPPAAIGQPDDAGESAPEPVDKRRSQGATGEAAQRQEKAGEESPVIYIGQ